MSSSKPFAIAQFDFHFTINQLSVDVIYNYTAKSEPVGFRLDL